MKVFIDTTKGENVVYSDIVKIIDKGKTVKLVDDCGFAIKKDKKDFEKITIEE